MAALLPTKTTTPQTMTAAFLPAGALAPNRVVLGGTCAHSKVSRVVKRCRRIPVGMKASSGNGSSSTGGSGGPGDGREPEFVLNSNESDAATSGEGDTEGSEKGAIGEGDEEASVFDWTEWKQSKEASDVPLLPFAPEEIWLPGESKRLHLYEARFLALFERCVLNYDKRFAHVLFASDRAALAAYGTIARVRHWRRLDVGVLVEIEGVARLRVSALKRASPFWSGACAFVDDNPVKTEDMEKVHQLERKAWNTAQKIIRLCVKLDEVPERVKVDTAARTLVDATGKDQVPAAPPIAGNNNGVFLLNEQAKCLAWESRLKMAASRAADGERFDFNIEKLDDSDKSVRRAKALSFAGWEYFPSSAGERQQALEGRDTIARLELVNIGLEVQAKRLEAKSALENAFSDPTA